MRVPRYLVAALVVLAAALIRLALPDLFGPPYILFYPAVMLIALLSGLGPGLLATALAALLAWFLVLPAKLEEHHHRLGDAIGLGVFTLLAVVMTAVAELSSRTRSRREDSRRQQALAEADDRVRTAEEQALRRYQALADGSRDPILFVRPGDGRILEANSAAERAYGYRREELLGLNVRDLRAPETRSLTEAQMAAADAGGLLFETVHRRRDGSTFAVEVSSRGATIDGTRTLVSIVRDISKASLAAEAMRQNEERYRGFFDNLNESVVVLEAVRGEGGAVVDWRCVASNATHQRLFGRSREEIVGSLMGDVMGPDWLRRLNPRNSQVLASGERVEEEITLGGRRLASTVFRIDASTLAVTALDVTEARMAADALREADRHKTEFLAVLSHELRNPLAPIRNSILLLDRAPHGSEAARRAGEVLRRQTDQLCRLVDDLLDVTRITHGKVELQLDRVDAGAVVGRAVRDAQAGFDQRGVSLQLGPVIGAIWVTADSARLSQIVGNLLSNALKFSSPGGTVRVGVRERDALCELSVEDGGIGIERADLDRIFEPFVQARRTSGAMPGGLGLGLALVRQLAVLHGGSVRATSAGPGQGSEFVVTLPVSSTPPAIEPAGVRGRPVKGLSILIVEDNEDAGASLADLLSLSGNQVTVAATGTAGIAAAAAGRPDVLICDLGLPDRPGHEVIRAIRATSPAPAVFAIALTGYAQPEDRARALEAGFDAHLAKPPDLDQLNEALAQASRRKS